MIETAVYDTKPDDRKYLERLGAGRIRGRFHDFRLNEETAITADGARAVCVFVNDHANRPCLAQLARAGVRLVALRCAGFNNVDLAAAKALRLPAPRAPP